jgi:hypothetical protein
LRLDRDAYVHVALYGGGTGEDVAALRLLLGELDRQLLLDLAFLDDDAALAAVALPAA